MSTGLEIIPAALVIGAVVARRRLKSEAARAKAGEQANVLELETRFNEQALIIEALGGNAVERNGVLHGEVGDVPIALTLDTDDRLFVAYFHADLPPEAAEEALRSLDRAYVELSNRDVRERVIDGAPDSGFVFEEQTVEGDGSVVLSLRVEDEATVRIRNRADGTVEAVTEGLKGDACLPYIDRIAELTGGTVVDSYFTDEYHEKVRAPARPEEVAEQPEIDIGGS
jgi:Protein of unknown function (DUF2997)